MVLLTDEDRVRAVYPNAHMASQQSDIWVQYRVLDEWRGIPIVPRFWSACTSRDGQAEAWYYAARHLQKHPNTRP